MLNVLTFKDIEFQLHDTTLFASDDQTYADRDQQKVFAKALERFPMRFSFQDGVTEAICPYDEESKWALNLKKGILSAFQNSMDNLEKDFKGTEVR